MARTNVIPIKKAPPPTEFQRDYVLVPEAARMADVSTVTMTNWCQRYENFARMVGGRWRVNRVLLERLLQGERLPRTTWVR